VQNSADVSLILVFTSYSLLFIFVDFFSYARYIAICPSTWKYGISPKTFPEAPLRKYKNELLWDDELKYRLRKDETYA
jgi:hypothetical protein